MRNQAFTLTGVGLFALLGSVLAVPACGSGGDDDDSSGGSNNAGSVSGGSGGSGGSSAGSVSGGTGGSTAGSGTGGVTTYACPGIVPPSSAITDFTDLMPPTAPMWGAAPAINAFYGGLFAYGGTDAIPVTDVTMGYLHATGRIKDFSGFGLYVSFCTDASKFDGVRFTISGDAGKAKSMLFAVQTNVNDYPDADAMKGVCQATPADKFIDCVPPGFTVTDIGATAKVVDVTWDKLTGGKPASAATTKGDNIIGLQWSFPWATGMVGYDVDVTIDDVEFIGADTGAGGAGAGGAGSDMAAGGLGLGGAK